MERKTFLGCCEEGGRVMQLQAQAKDPVHSRAHSRGDGAICSANSAPVVPGPSNNVPVSNLGCNLSHYCVAPLISALRAFLSSPHPEEIFFHLGRRLHFSQTQLSNILAIFWIPLLCDGQGFRKQRLAVFSFSPTFFSPINKIANA